MSSVHVLSQHGVVMQTWLVHWNKKQATQERVFKVAGFTWASLAGLMSQPQISGRVAAGDVAVKQQHKMMMMMMLLMSVHMHYLAVVLGAGWCVPLKDNILKSASHWQLCFYTKHDSAWG